MSHAWDSVGQHTRVANTERNSDNKDRRIECKCGLKHRFKDCWYLGGKGKPQGWVPKPEIQEKFGKLMESQSPIGRAIKATLKANTGTTALTAVSTLRQFDDQSPTIGNISSHVLQLTMSTDCTNKQTIKPSLINRWILDPGSNTHVTNTRAYGWKKRADGTGEVVKAGNQELAIREWGDVILLINTPTGTEQIELTYVAYVPGFLTNVVGLSRCRSIGIHFDSGRDCLYQRRWNNVISKLQYVGGHWLIDADGMERPDAGPLLAASTHAYKKPSHEPRKPLRLTLEEAHVMWGHAGRQAIGHLPGSVDGLELVDGEQAPKWKDCDTCIQSKLTQLVSRRLPREPATRPFQRTSIDLIQLLERGERCYNGDQYLFHMVDQDSKWHEGSCMPDKTKATLTRVFKRLLAKIERQYNSQVIVIRLDMEAGYVELLEICKNLGIALEPRATEAQNGGIERAGKSIVIRARAVRLHAGLPEEYANECAMTAIYLLNRTPVEAINWSCPYTKVKGVKPSVAHLEVIGARAYVLNEKLLRGAKLESRALIGHLVGFDSTNIFRIWLPTIGRVIRTRDVVFLRDKLCDGQGQYAEKSYIREVAEVLDIENTPDYSNILTDQLSSPEDVNVQQDAHRSENDMEDEIEDPISDTIHVQPRRRTNQQDDSQQQETMRHLRTPEATSESQEVSQLTDQEMDDTGWERGYALAPEGEALNRTSNNARRREEISSQVSEQFILKGKRSRKPVNLGTYLATFATCINPTAPAKLFNEAPKIRFHRDQLPAVPKRWKDLDHHPFGAEFREASRKEIDGFTQRSCFGKTARASEIVDAEILPLMWVFTYKFDEDGYLYKFKARLVVRGDLQQDYGDTYAATLAAKIFRCLIALSAAFDLELYQYDVLNAFLNAELDRLTYHLTATLEKLGLQQVPGVPCLFSNDSLIVFFFVDDIVVAVASKNKDVYRQFDQQLRAAYDVRFLGELKWFLGIRVIRDRSQKKIWLMQDSFIDKVAAKYNITQRSTTYPAVPLADGNIGLSTEEPDNKRTKLYQELVGSLAYIATYTRPDVAQAHSELSRYLQNPGQKHVSAAYHVWKYLIGQKRLAIGAHGDQSSRTIYTGSSLGGAGTEPLFYGASDAAFADDLPTRRSSQGYLFMLYGMPIDWKATLQRSVTKSTTEAELLALSTAASELQAWNRLFKHIRFDLEMIPTIYCDNLQTVGVVTKDEDKLFTRLRHVDVHQHWLRQEVADGRISVQWKPTNLMPADGLTKMLVRQKHVEFLKQLGLRDVNEYLPNAGQDSPDLESLTHWY
ncbi:Pol protein [Pyrenophora tritici-repentis]|uniref:Pol protein n=2 Tax=Pyrenophora tritici-repentis TaxID=45151 RepID=A0A922N536_9PLEO|nr:Pol protein [Pyrenophora tritici-repentis]